MSLRRVMVRGTTGSGKTTLARELAERLGVEYVEMDAIYHLPNWTERPREETCAIVEEIVQRDGWVIDGQYAGKLGTLVLDAADTVVWLDLPLRVWLRRLLRRTWRRYRGREALWNDNRETLKNAFWGRQSLFAFALRTHFGRRRRWPVELAPYRVVRLRSVADVERWLAQVF